MTATPTTEPRPADPGDLVAVLDGDAWTIGVADGRDFAWIADRPIPIRSRESSRVGRPNRFRPSAGSLVGHRFGTYDELQAAAQPHRTD